MAAGVSWGATAAGSAGGSPVGLGSSALPAPAVTRQQAALTEQRTSNEASRPGMAWLSGMRRAGTRVLSIKARAGARAWRNRKNHRFARTPIGRLREERLKAGP